MTGIVALLLFAFFALVGYAVSGWAQDREEAKEALGRRLTTMTGASVGAASAALMKDRRLSRIGLFNAILQHLAITKNLVRVIRQAGLKKRVGEVLLYVPLLAAAAFIAATLLLGKLMFAVLAAVFAGLLPLMIVLRLRRRRMALFGEQLPDALDLIRAALHAGLGFLSALQVVAEEFPDPIAAELTEVAEEIRLGLTVREALQHLTERMEDPNLPILATGVVITQEVGGNLAEVLDNISYTIRERFKLLREVRVLTAQGRLSGLVLTALPFFVALALILLRPEYFKPLVESKQGLYMTGYGLCSIVLGHILIQRIVRIKECYGDHPRPYAAHVRDRDGRHRRGVLLAVGGVAGRAALEDPRPGPRRPGAGQEEGAQRGSAPARPARHVQLRRERELARQAARLRGHSRSARRGALPRHAHALQHRPGAVRARAAHLLRQAARVRPAPGRPRVDSRPRAGEPLAARQGHAARAGAHQRAPRHPRPHGHLPRGRPRPQCSHRPHWRGAGRHERRPRPGVRAGRLRAAQRPDARGRAPRAGRPQRRRGPEGACRSHHPERSARREHGADATLACRPAAHQAPAACGRARP